MNIDNSLRESWWFYRRTEMTQEEMRAASMLTPISAPLGLTEWKTTDGQLYAKGANAISAQAGINARAQEGGAA